MGLFVCIGEDLLYFRGGREGRVRVACRLLYPIFEIWRGYCIFMALVMVCFTITIFCERDRVEWS